MFSPISEFRFSRKNTNNFKQSGTTNSLHLIWMRRSQRHRAAEKHVGLSLYNRCDIGKLQIFIAYRCYGELSQCSKNEVTRVYHRKFSRLPLGERGTQFENTVSRLSFKNCKWRGHAAN